MSLNVLGQSKQTNLYTQEHEILLNILSGLLVNSEDNVKKFYDINSFKTMYFISLLFNNSKICLLKTARLLFCPIFSVKKNKKY